MPSGLTSVITEGGASFRQFALRCARYMAINAWQRDESFDLPPRRQEVDTIYRVWRDDAARELERLLSMTVEEAAREARAEHDHLVRVRQEAIRDRDRDRVKYEAMLEKVRAWEPPTDEHCSLKELMVEQIERTIAHDSFPQSWTEPVLLSAVEWLDARKKRVADRVTSAKDEHERAVARAAECNAWNEALLASLPPEGK